MIKYTHTRLMYPEPDDVGGGDVATEPVEDTTTATESKNAFDFEDLPDVEESNEAEPDKETESGDDDYALTLPEDLDLEKEEVAIITAAAKKYGIDKEAASGMVVEFTKGIHANMQKMQDAARAEAEKNLREQWGNSFGANVKKAGELITRVGKAAGWSKEMIDGFKNAADMRIFYDIARVMGSGKTVGLASAPTAAPMTKADLDESLTRTVVEFWNAKSRGDTKEMQALSDKHLELQKQRYGKGAATRMLYF